MSKSREIRTVAELFYEALRFDRPDAMAYRLGKTYRLISHRDVQATVERLALAMHERGLRPGDRVAILSENRPEWAFVDYACAISGLVSVPLYHTLSPEQTAEILRGSGARWVFCSNVDHLAKVRAEWPGLPELRLAVWMDGERNGPDTLSWADLMTEGERLSVRREEVQAWAAERRPAELLTIVYTSGTTGEPKGAMLTHGNLVSNILACLEHLHPGSVGRCLSMLPLSHIFERMAGHFLMFHCGISIYYAKSLQSLPQDLMDVRPNVLVAVPRIFEKIYNHVRDTAVASGWIKRGIFAWSVALGRRLSDYAILQRKPPLWLRLQGRLADALVFSRIRARTGGHLRFAISGGAPLGPRIQRFFWALGIPIYEGYGLTETSPVLTLNRPGKVLPGSVGLPIMDRWRGQPFLKLADDGEILCRGPNIMQGYWNDPKATQLVIDAEGFFHTGDVGEMDETGRVRITDRKKDILVTSGGKNVAPQPIENLLRSDRYISQAIVVGDRKNFLAALIVPYFPMLRRWASYKKLAFSTDAELASLPEARDKIMRRIDRLNERLSNFERIRKISLLEEELTPESGLLTPSMKVKRRAVYAAFTDRIEAMYGDNPAEAQEEEEPWSADMPHPSSPLKK